jgi:malate dehydrogenase
VAADDARICVVGNPCNTNCMIAAAQSKRHGPERFTAMVRLDQNRAHSIIAAKAGAAVAEVKDLYIYGNHSPTMFADYTHATIGGKAAADVVGDRAWLETEFLPTVGGRGGAILAARGQSSAGSAAGAIIDYVRDLTTPGKVHSIAVSSEGRYGFAEGIWAGMPVRSTGGGTYEVVETFAMDDFAKSKLAKTNEELVAERDTVKELIGSR